MLEEGGASGERSFSPVHHHWVLFFGCTPLNHRPSCQIRFSVQVYPTLLKGFVREHDSLILPELHFLYTPVNCKNSISPGEVGSKCRVVAMKQ